MLMVAMIAVLVISNMGSTKMQDSVASSVALCQGNHQCPSRLDAIEILE